MIEIDKAFPKAGLYRQDMYVADYTLMTKGEEGVRFLMAKPENIECFHLENLRETEYWGVNFEEERTFFRGNSQCEGMFVSSNAKRKGWVCLLELKYCREKNITGNVGKAFSQLKSTLAFLESKEVIDRRRQRVYLNISIPDYSNREPFTGFMLTQDVVLEMKEKHHVILLGYNNLLILNEAFIKIPKRL